MWQGRPAPGSLSATHGCPEVPGPCGGTCRSQLTALEGEFTPDAAVMRINTPYKPRAGGQTAQARIQQVTATDTDASCREQRKGMSEDRISP